MNIFGKTFMNTLLTGETSTEHDTMHITNQAGL